jgi:hypothetical protein
MARTLKKIIYVVITLSTQRTLIKRKKNQIFLIYKEIQMGSGAKLYPYD